MRAPLWRQQGQEPDYRFSLANERTFLAWIRTALGLLAGGVVLDQFATTLGPPMVVAGLAIVFGLLAAMLCTLAYVRWRANEIAMRHAQNLPNTIAIPLIAGVAVLITAAIVALLVARLT
ncbi:YidH family protein [Rhodococcus sp. IEGM1300]|jgi:putative membrane protein